MIADYLHAFKVILAIPFLIYACKVDLEERRVPNRVWKYMLATLLPIVFVEYLLTEFNLIFAVIQFAFIFTLSYMLFRLGMWGGADAKALMVLSASFPVFPEISALPLLNKGFGILAFSTLSNSVIFSPAVVIYVFLKNLKSGLKNGNPIYYFTGYQVDADKIPRFHNLLEFIDKDKIVRVKKGIEPDEKMLMGLKKAKKAGRIDKVWVTPGLPFLVFITAGFLISVIIGDVLFEFVKLFLIWKN